MSYGLLDKLRRELEIVNSSSKTVKSYKYYVSLYLNYASKRGVNESTVKDFIQREIKIKDVSTVSIEIAAIKFFFDKVLKQNIELKHPKRNKKIPLVLEKSEIRRMIENTRNIKHKLIIKMIYGCGLRLNELIN